jgi:hypothetical protein
MPVANTAPVAAENLSSERRSIELRMVELMWRLVIPLPPLMDAPVPRVID